MQSRLPQVLFCGKDMHYAYQFTAEELAGEPGVEVVQCEREAVPAELRDADVAVPLMAPLAAAELRAAPRLKLVLQFGVGVEGVDLRAAADLGVFVSNIPSAGTGNAASCAEMALYLMLATLRNANAMADSIQRRRLGVPLGSMLAGKRVLVLGFGSIAKELITRLVPFGVTLSALRRSPHWGTASDALSLGAEAALADRGTWPADAARLAREADVVVVTCRLDATNAGMVGAAFLATCKQGVRIVNVARGGLLEYEAVAEGLRSGKIGGMGLDVQFFEPFDPGDYVATHPAVVLTPHVAGVTKQSCRLIGWLLAAGCWLLAAGCWLLAAGCWLLAAGCCVVV